MNRQTIYQGKIHHCFKALKTSPKGLNNTDVLRRYKQYGLNHIGKIQFPNLIELLIRQLNNPIIVILIAITVLSFMTESYWEANILVSLILLNIGIDIFQIYQSFRQLNALSGIIRDKCVVVRESKKISVDSDMLVPGDLVILGAGARVPADIRLIESENFRVNEFLITGNPNPVLKDAQQISTNYLPIAERLNSVFMGTEVVSGTATGLVYAIGKHTEIGKISLAARLSENKSPIAAEMTYLSRFVAGAGLGIGILIFVVYRFFGENNSDNEIFLHAIDLATSVLPAALPFQVALVLALSARETLKSGILLKESRTSEIFGNIDTIALDKTATVTLNELVVTDVFINQNSYKVTGTNGYEPKGEIMNEKGEFFKISSQQELFWLIPRLASSTRTYTPDNYHQRWWHNGDLVEAAIACFVQKAGYDTYQIEKNYPRIAYFPFDAHRKRVATVHLKGEQRMAFVKGSLESILEICTHYLKDGKASLLTERRREKIIQKAKSLAAESKMLIGFAYKELVFRKHYTVEEVEFEMIFVGFLGIYDPPQTGMKESIEILSQSNIELCMITGDSKLTAQAVAQDVGLTHAQDVGLTGREIEQISNAEDFRKLVEEKNIKVFSQSSPQDKAKIVSYLQANGKTVAMVGDGVNDVASIRQSHIGIATFSSSPVTVAAADAVLMHNDFSLLLKGISEGRRIYENIKKIMLCSLSSNFAELFCAFVGIFLEFSPHFTKNDEVPLLVLYVLLIDLVGEMLPLLALAWDDAQRDLIKYPPRYREKRINTQSLLSTALTGSVMGLLSSLVFLVSYFWIGSSAIVAASACFLSINILQYINILDRRTEENSIFTKYLLSNPKLLLAMLLSFGLLLLTIFFVAGVFLGWKEYMAILAMALVFLVGVEIKKRYFFNANLL